ncbi:hypothetical protein JNB71_02700 [Rhizobium herbae]|uniref:Uncharacterized protein n=1 Tax=Rhizobium herbae TaxID=508661 RepID=A0ABS7H4R9_9HYPH|nr:hypothetical protein [Rhizobium herbae]MBW9062217.1 hypothetical protein [Rhizobium herbae]
MAEINDPTRRDIIAETAFNVATLRFLATGMAYSEILETAESVATVQLEALRNRYAKEKISPLNTTEIEEVDRAQNRIYEFGLKINHNNNLIFKPTFSGHGFIHLCEGDLRTDREIVEFKYVSRNFRSSDLKQTLVYCCLNFFEDKNSFERIILVNPFRGAILEVRTDELVNACGGVSFDEFAYRFSYYVCSGDVSR